MRVYKFLSLSAFITCFCLLYVYQQAEILRFAYIGQKKQAFFEDLLDRNSVLRYNIEKSASLIFIGDRISKSGEFQMPDECRLVKLSPSTEDLKTKIGSLDRQTLFSKIFSVKRQAEARTINP